MVSIVLISYINGAEIGFCKPLTLFDTVLKLVWKWILKSPMIMPDTEGDFSVLKPTCSTLVPVF